jgi:uncharacterized cupredoxin-like copper-binding protein
MKRATKVTPPLLSGLVLATPSSPVAALAHSPGEPHGHTDFGEPGNPKKPARIVRIAMREEGAQMLFVPDRMEVSKGEQIRFVLTNEGFVKHEFVLGTQKEINEHAKEMKKNPCMEHDGAHSSCITS